jgi:hypothetical protein
MFTRKESYIRECIQAAKLVLDEAKKQQALDTASSSGSKDASSGNKDASSDSKDVWTQKWLQGAAASRSAGVNLDESSDEDEDATANGAPGSGGGHSFKPQVKRTLFEGAASAAHDLVKPQWRCADCNCCTSKISEMAYLNMDNTFVKYVDKKMDDALKQAHGKEAGPWANKYQNLTTTRLVCVWCCEKLHQKMYHHPGGHEKAGKLTPEWDRLRKQSFQMNINKTKCGFVLKQTDKIAQERGEVREVSAVELYEKLCKHENLKLSRDWVTDMGPLAVMLYGCPCGCYPLKNGAWYKCVKWGTEMVEGMTDNGEGSGAYWVCAVCGLRWNWTYGHLRLFIVGTRQSIMEGRYWFRHVGDNVDSRLNVKIMEPQI